MNKLISIVTTFSVVLCLASCGGNSKSSVNVPTEYCEELVKLAEEGNAEAQYQLGLCYEYGKGIEKSITEAVELYRKAAEQGEVNGQFVLGCCYYNGYGVTQSYAEAVKWYRKAAEQGNGPAQNNLGICYDNGYGVTQSYAEAVKWYRKAAEQGIKTAQYCLGVCYLKGEGVEQSESEGAKWLTEAANQGHADAQAAMGYLYYHYGHYADAIGRYCQAALQGQERAVTAMNTWIRIKAESGNPVAQCAWGFFARQNGHTDEAIKWFKLASEQGNETATKELKKCNKLWH